MIFLSQILSPQETQAIFSLLRPLAQWLKWLSSYHGDRRLVPLWKAVKKTGGSWGGVFPKVGKDGKTLIHANLVAIYSCFLAEVLGVLIFRRKVVWVWANLKTFVCVNVEGKKYPPPPKKKNKEDGAQGLCQLLVLTICSLFCEVFWTKTRWRVQGVSTTNVQKQIYWSKIHQTPQYCWWNIFGTSWWSQHCYLIPPRSLTLRPWKWTESQYEAGSSFLSHHGFLNSCNTEVWTIHRWHPCPKAFLGAWNFKR